MNNMNNETPLYNISRESLLFILIQLKYPYGKDKRSHILPFHIMQLKYPYGKDKMKPPRKHPQKMLKTLHKSNFSLTQNIS